MNDSANFSLKKFFIGNATYAFFNVSLIVLLLVPFLRFYGYDKLQLSSIISVKELSTFICMYIGGILFDKFGPRKAFLCGRILDIISLILLLSNNNTIIIMSIILIGVSYGIMFGKYTSYIYNTLSVKGELKWYARFASGYYFSWDITISAIGLFASLLLKTYGFNLLIYISIIFKICSIICIFIFIPSNKNKFYNFESFQSRTIKDIVLSILDCVKSGKIFIDFVLFYGLLNFITWDLSVKIGDMFFIDLGWKPSSIASYTSILSIFMAIGTAIPMIFLPQGISIKKCLVLNLIETIILLISSIIYNDKMFLFSFFLICFTFSLIEVSVEKKFEYVSNKKVRGSVISIAISIGTLITILCTMLVGVVSKFSSYHISSIVLSIIMLLFSLYLFFSIKNKNI